MISRIEVGKYVSLASWIDNNTAGKLDLQMNKKYKIRSVGYNDGDRVFEHCVVLRNCDGVERPYNLCWFGEVGDRIELLGKVDGKIK